VEDRNAVEKSTGSFKRYALVLPLTEAFEPPLTRGYGKLQFSDRVSVPASYNAEIAKRNLEVPWHFEIKPVLGDEVPVNYDGDADDASLVRQLGHPGIEEPRVRPLSRPASRSRQREGDASGTAIGLLPKLARCFCSPVDFRSPENFVYVPLWIMRQLRLKPYDAVTMTSCKLKDGVRIELQPHQDAFLKLANPRAVLESELKYYTY
jgi:hypothetical protein